MSTDLKAKKTSNRTNREDGDITKARIIEAAGTLFAERGYAETTSKEICELAQTSITGVNYHFGSREGLYLVTLRTMHDYISAPEFMAEMVASPLSPREKLAFCIDRLAAKITKESSWQVKLWAREMISPSQFALQLTHEKVIPKISITMHIISEITGLPMGSKELEFATLNFMAPFFMLLVATRNDNCPHAKLLDCDREIMVKNLKTFIFGGLDALAEKQSVYNHIKGSPT